MMNFDQLRGRRCHAIVSTPLQYLNAMELVVALECPERYLVVLEEHYTLEDFSRLPYFSEWTEVIEVPVGKPLKFPAGGWRRGLKEALVDRRLHRCFIRQLKHWPKADLVVMGNPRELRHHDFCGLVGGRDTLICEDGTATLRRDVGELSRAKRLRRRLLGIDDHEVDKACWFTAYPEAMGERRHLVNRYAYLCGLLASRRQKEAVSDEIWLLGQPLAELELLSAVDYRALITEIAQQIYAGQTLLYWPHPRETRENLVELERIPGLEVIKRSKPIELELIGAEVLPQRVATFYSSAYRTSQAIFGETVPFDILEPCDSHWTKGHPEVSIMEECYAVYRRDLQPPNRFWHQGRDHCWRLLSDSDSGIDFDIAPTPSEPALTESSSASERAAS